MTNLAYKDWLPWQKALVDDGPIGLLVDEWHVDSETPNAVTMRARLPGADRFVTFAPKAIPDTGDDAIRLPDGFTVSGVMTFACLEYLRSTVYPLQLLAEINSTPFMVRRIREPDHRVHLSDFDTMVRNAIIAWTDSQDWAEHERDVHGRGGAEFNSVITRWDDYVTGERQPLRDGFDCCIARAIVNVLHPNAALETDGWRRPA